MTDIFETARLWLNKEQEGLNLTTCKEFQEWVNKSAKHKEAFEEEKDFRELFKTLPTNTLEEISFENQKEIRKDKYLKKILKTSFSAALFCLIFFASYFTYNYYTPSFEQTYLAVNKVRKDIKLPDSSIISLDKNSKIEVKYLKNKRKIQLKEGKALFSVTSNKSRPFLVKTNNTIVEVLGTKFEVQKQKDKVQISVVEGKVSVKHILTNSNAQILAVLEKADSIEIDKFGKISNLKKVNEKLIASWQKDKLLFKQTKLKEVIEKFSEYLDYKVIIEDKSLKTLPISGEFSINDFDNLMKSLSIIHPIKTYKIGNTYYIKKKI